MNKITLLTVVLLFLSCAREAEQIRLDKGSFAYKGVSFLIDENKISETPRNISLITFPNAKDVKSFSIEFNETEMEKYLGNLNYYSNIPKRIEIDEDNDEKTSKIVQIIAASSDASDKWFKVKKPLEKELAQREIGLDTLIKSLVKKHPCFKISIEENKGKCSSLPIDGQTRTQPSFAKPNNCRTFKKFKKKFVRLTAEDKLAFKNSTKECNALKDIRDDVRDRESKLDKIITKESKAFVLKELSAVNKLTGVEYIHTVFLTEGNDSGRSTRIKMNQKTISGFDLFEMVIKFGNNKAKVFTPTNGGIQKLRLGPNERGDKVLSFEIHDVDKIIKIKEAALSSHGVYGVRFAGSTEVFYKNGSFRKGTIKIEFD